MTKQAGKSQSVNSAQGANAAQARSAEIAPKPKCPETHDDIPCQKGMTLLSDGTWDHGGGHWFMSDDLTACMDAGHYDPANILSMTPLVHLDMPCPRRKS